MTFCPVCGHGNSDNATRCTNPECGYEFYTNSDNHKTRLMDGTGPDLEQGSLISGRYEIVRELGRGGMGVVYLVKDAKLRGREVALKMIHPELISHEEARQRFIDEVLLCLDLHHPNIVIVYPIEETDRNLFFTMEYIPGQSLRQLMDDRQGRVPPFTLDETCCVINQILDALAYAHKTTIHRDIKPENIIVRGNFPDIQVKVLDFGIAKVLSASRFTRTAQSMGTAYYMSPEQMKGAKKIDLRSDLYAVGMILYEMLTADIAAGRFKLPTEIIKGLPPEIDPVIETVLSTNPMERYESAAQLKQALLPLPESAGKIASEELHKTVTALIARADFNQAREQVKQSGLSEQSLLDQIRKTEEKYSSDMSKGLALVASNDFQAAREQFSFALETCPEAEEPHTRLKNVDQTIHLAREKERQEQAALAKARTEKQIREAVGLCDASMRQADFSTAKQHLAKATGLDPNPSACIKAREQLEETEKQYDARISNAGDAIASGHYDQAESDINKARLLCPQSDQVGQLKAELEKARSATKFKAVFFRFVVVFLVIGAGVYFYILQNKPVRHSPRPASKPVQQSSEIGQTKWKKVSAPDPGKSWTEPNTGMEFVWVPKGCYQMGDTFNDGYSREKPVHEVCLDGFWMGRYEVTQAEYKKVTGKNPSEFKGDRRPVESVSWEDAKSFISKLNSRTGQTFSLPTEAQWEYAAREGGKRVRFGTGKDTIGPDEANFDASSEHKKSYSRSGEYRGKTVKVGSFSSNSLGLYDMSGNVWEWCEDVYVSDAYKKHSKNNPVITSEGSFRVLRGGSWSSIPWYLRAAIRYGFSPSFRYGYIGFRLVLVSRGQ